jgi:Fungal specific transcription factor domain
METPSNFAFVETGSTTSGRGRGTPRGSSARSLIRSHAMQQVWEQRRLKRAQGNGDGSLQIVLENETLKDSEKAKLNSSRRQSGTATGMAAAKSVKRLPSRKLLRSKTLDEAMYSSNSKTHMIDSEHNDPREVEGEAKRKPKISSAAALRVKQSAKSYSGYLQACWNSSATTSPTTVGMCLTDPFDTCAVSLGPTESRYIAHYFQALSWRFTLPKKTWLRYAIHDPGLLHGVLAIAAAHYSFATTRGLSDDALYHHGMTINHVQKCLEDPVLRFSDSVIGAIGRMVICHLIFGNRQHFITHIKAFQRSAEARGGLENLGMVGQLKYIIASCVAGAATIWWEDVPPQLRRPYGLLDYPAIDDIPDAEPCDPEWGSAFRELNKIGFLSDALLDICEAMVALNSVINSRRTWDEPQQRIFGDQCNKISLRLVYLKEDEAVSHREVTARDHMRECVRLAVHFYVSAFQRDVPLLSNLSIQTLHQLKESLYLTDLQTSWGGGQLGEVLLWVLIITASGCVRPQERGCAGTQLQKTAMQLGVTQWLEVKRICKRFLFLDSAVEWKTWPLWKDYGPRSEDNLSTVQSESGVLATVERVLVVH